MPLLELSRMDSPPKLTGETLIVHHIPLVHCQVPDRQCCGVPSGGSGSTRPNPFCPPELGLTKSDQDLGQADSLLYNSLHSAPGASTRSSDSSKSRSRDGRGPGASKRHNPFLVQEGVGEAGLGDLCDDNTGESATQQSFHLHSASQPTFHLSSFQLPSSGPGLRRPWCATRSRPGVVEGQEQEPAAALGTQQGSTSHCCQPEPDSETMELDECGGPGGSGSGEGASDTSAFSFEQEWKLSSDESPRNPGRSGLGAQHCHCSSASSQSEAADQSMGYVSDSSCNSSDGVLVTFSTLYNKAHGSSRANLNSVPPSCSDSSFCSQSDPGAFYLDLQPSPAESKMSCESHHPETGDREEGCGCPHASSPELDANCNSYRPHCEPCPAVADLTACFQSQARLVVATQNYYKLVTCDLSSQSSPSPAGSSITSCSEEHTKISPPPGPGSEPDPSQPSEYYLFQKPDIPPEEQGGVASSMEAATTLGPTVLEGQVYTNTSPPNLSTGRQRSRSYDRSLERSPTVRLGSLERMLSCPVRLSEGPAALAGPASPPRRVTSFAELAKGRKKTAPGSGSPPLRVSIGDSSQDFSPIQEAQHDRAGPLDEGTRCSHSLPAMPLGPSLDLLGPEPWSTQLCQGSQSNEVSLPSLRAAGQGPLAQLMDPGPALPGSPASSHTQRDARARADGGGTESRPVLRYSKEQRPTTLPIQPFVFQHHFPKQLAKARALHSLSQLYSLSGCSRAQQQQPASLVISATQGPAPAPSGEPQPFTPHTTGRGARKAGPEPETSRPSPLGSYSPIRSAGPFGPSTDSSSSTSCSPPPEQAAAAESLPLWSHPCPPVRPAASQQPLKEDQKIPTLTEYRLHGTGSLPPLGSWRSGFSRAESLARGGGEGSMASRPNNANHLSPQALKWREYRRKNPLGPPGLSGSLDRRPQEARLARRNPIFEFPGSFGPASHLNYRLNGQVAKPLPLTCPDLQDPFSLTEKPPAEFCLSPDGSSEAISIDVLQKKGLVKAVNTAVDLIVAHFGTSRDPGVKAKLGNSSVSPNVGHLVLKYLCPAVQAVLDDGLKAFVLDVIIGQRKNTPWSVVEASTQLGPSTKVLHGLYNKVSQFPELTSHTMRFNAFILGLLNIRSLEFWFNHLYNHEDIIQTHYQPWGFLRAAHTVCPGLFEELLLLLQPLALLPFSLDVLFQHRLLQSGQQQRQHKELLRVSQDLLLSAHSTLQLARARGQEGPGERVKGVGASEGGEEDEEDTEEAAAVAGGSSEHSRWTRGGQAGWWYQLMQSSQVYIDGATEGSRFPRSSSAGSEKKKGVGSGGPSQALPPPPPREGVVEGAEACPAPEEALGQERGWPFWMGSPPDSVLAELRRSREREGPVAPPTENEDGTAEPSSGGIKWGHLFGSRKAQREARPANRLPSDWLSLDRSVFQLVAQTMGSRREPEPRENLQESHPPALPSKPPCEVQALCHHLATGPGQLSFHKGDVLRVLGPAGGDWLHCSRGPDTGLVPLAYVTLTPTPSSPPGSSQN